MKIPHEEINNEDCAVKPDKSKMTVEKEVNVEG